MNQSFDVCELRQNPQLYDGQDLSIRRLGQFDSCTASNIPLRVGDALVLRQYEVHRTDRAPLEPWQMRLAIGFKLMRPGVVQQSTPCTSLVAPYPLAVCPAVSGKFGQTQQHLPGSHVTRSAFDAANFKFRLRRV